MTSNASFSRSRGDCPACPQMVDQLIPRSARWDLTARAVPGSRRFRDECTTCMNGVVIPGARVKRISDRGRARHGAGLRVCWPGGGPRRYRPDEECKRPHCHHAQRVQLQGWAGTFGPG